MTPHSFNILDPELRQITMISIWYFAQGVRRQALALSLIIIMMTTTTLTTAITIFSPPLVQSAFAEHGQEIELTPKDMAFAPILSGEGNQVKVAINYAVHDPMVVNDLVKAVMKVYSPDGKLLKTSSSPTPFPITDSQGTATLATTLTDPKIQDVIAKIVFTNPIKTETISNELPVTIDLIRGPVLSAESQEQEQDKTIPQEELKSDLESEEQASTRPLSKEKLMSTESTVPSSKTEKEEQQPPAESEDAPIFSEEQKVTSTESLLPTTADSPLIAPTMVTPPTTNALPSNLAEEICDDDLDNDNDALIDFIDEQCNQESQPEQQPQLPIQQEEVIVSTQEICDDDLDNDFDGRVDSRDEECSYITSSSSSFPSPEQTQPVTNKNTEGEIVDSEQQPNVDLTEESTDDAEENNDDEGNNSEDEEDENEDKEAEQESDEEDNDDDES